MTAMIDDSYSRARDAQDGLGAHRLWVMVAFLLGAIARETLGDPEAARPAPRSSAACGALTHGETRVLQYMPTNLSAREIARELCVSVNTVKTHQRHLYQKLGAQSRSQAVTQARALGLVAPSSRPGSGVSGRTGRAGA
jgi:LuxR family transcriptional regulator, maltose regulon positive regulatory protein